MMKEEGINVSYVNNCFYVDDWICLYYFYYINPFVTPSDLVMLITVFMWTTESVYIIIIILTRLLPLLIWTLSVAPLFTKNS